MCLCSQNCTAPPLVSCIVSMPSQISLSRVNDGGNQPARYSLAGWDIWLSVERPGFKSRRRKLVAMSSLSHSSMVSKDVKLHYMGCEHCLPAIFRNGHRRPIDQPTIRKHLDGCCFSGVTLQHRRKHGFIDDHAILDPLRRSSVKIGTIQGISAWPLREDDTHK